MQVDHWKGKEIEESKIRKLYKVEMMIIGEIEQIYMTNIALRQKHQEFRIHGGKR